MQKTLVTKLVVAKGKERFNEFKTKGNFQKPHLSKNYNSQVVAQKTGSNDIIKAV